MSKKAAKNIIQQIAKKEGIQESEVRLEMERAILIGCLNPNSRGKWDALFGAGRIPEPEDFIEVLSKKAAIG